jgi:hypothetical protein
MNVLTRFSAMAPHIKGKCLNELFPANYLQNMPYQEVQPYHCIVPNCRQLMHHHEMFPKDRLTARAICPECWDALTSISTRECWVCGDDLDSKHNQQQFHPRDIHNRIHSGMCCDYFSLVSAKALGRDTGILEIYAGEVQHIGFRRIIQDHKNDIDIPYLNSDHHPTRIQRVFSQPPKALPMPGEKLRVPDHIEGIRELIPVKRTYKGKKVLRVDINRDKKKW